MMLKLFHFFCSMIELSVFGKFSNTEFKVLLFLFNWHYLIVNIDFDIYLNFFLIFMRSNCSMSWIDWFWLWLFNFNNLFIVYISCYLLCEIWFEICIIWFICLIRYIQINLDLNIIYLCFESNRNCFKCFNFESY